MIQVDLYNIYSYLCLFILQISFVELLSVIGPKWNKFVDHFRYICEQKSRELGGNNKVFDYFSNGNSTFNKRDLDDGLRKWGINMPNEKSVQ